MISIDVRADVRQVERMLKGMTTLVRKAAATALTDAAYEGKKAIEKEMGKVFDRPTRYTLNSLRIKRARSNHLIAEVWVKNKLDAGKGTSPEDYLLPQIYGGSRNLKRFEHALRKRGILPPGMYAVPGPGADMDANGNMSRGQIVQILSYLQAFGEQGYRANSTAASRARMARGSKSKRSIAYFVSHGGRLAAGVWKRTQFAFGSAIKPVIMFVQSPRYTKRLKFHEIGYTVARREFVPRFHAALKKSLAAKNGRASVSRAA